MRLVGFISESSQDASIDEVLNLIYTDCMPFVKDLAKDKSKLSHRLLFSGRNNSKDYFTGKVRSDRRPKDTDEFVHEIFDELFNKNFGFRARSNAIFCTGRESTAKSYGSNVYIIFPKGQYKFVYNPKIIDLYMEGEGLWGSDGGYDSYIDEMILDLRDEWYQDLESEWEDRYGEGGEGWWRITIDDVDIDDIEATSEKKLIDKVKSMMLGKEPFPQSREFFTFYKKVNKMPDEDGIRDRVIEVLDDRSAKDYSTEWFPDISKEEYIHDGISDREQDAYQDARSRDSFEDYIDNEINEWWGLNSKNYKSTGIVDAINAEVEVMLNCKEYIAIHSLYKDAILEYIKKNGTNPPIEKRIKDWWIKNNGRLPKQLSLFRGIKNIDIKS